VLCCLPEIAVQWDWVGVLLEQIITAESTESRDYKARHELNDGLSSFIPLP